MTIYLNRSLSYYTVMPLRIRILLWVSSLFLFTMFFVFLFSNIEINRNLKAEKKNLIEKVREVDKKNIENILKFLSTSVNDHAEAIFNAFIFMETSPISLAHFVPDKYNIRTKSWGSSADILLNYPWIDLVSSQINGKLDSYIHQSSPFLRKYVKIEIAEDLVLLATLKDDGTYHAYVGVPILPNQRLFKHKDKKDFLEVFLTNEPDHWVLYDVENLLSVDTKKLYLPSEKIYQLLSRKTSTIQSKDSFDFLFDTFKLMVDVTKEELKKRPNLVDTLRNKSKNAQFVQERLTLINPNMDFQRSYCREPLCEFANKFKDSKWKTRTNFANKLIQTSLIWKLALMTRSGIWDYDPFEKGAPQGMVTQVIPTYKRDPSFFDHVVEGFFTSDVFLDTTIATPRGGSFSPNKDFNQSLAITQDKNALVETSDNKDYRILYNESLREPYLVNTKFISYIKAPMQTPNITALTLGVHLDKMFVNLALVSPDEVAVIFNGGDIRLYTTDGRILHTLNDKDNQNRKKIMTQKEGFLVDSKGDKLFFTHLAKLTNDDGHIVLIEKEVSRTSMINAINKHIKDLTFKIILYSSILIVASLIVVMIILSKVISAITKPINQLAKLTVDVTSRKLDSIELKEVHLKRKDEIGALYSSFKEMIRTMKEGVKVRGILDKVVSKEVAEKIVKEGVALGGEKKKVSVVFCDIRKFTSITENMDPVDVLMMLNECLTLLSGVIDDFEGVIDKYEGDKIMTLFGAPLDNPNHSIQAVLCALKMQETMVIWNKKRAEENKVPIEVGIGIHSGEVVAGNVGAENHLSYTVLGHIVNLSSRLCDFAVAREILITEETLAGCDNKIEVEQKEPHQFKGISQAITTYSVLRSKS
ncbi:MAG: hypothetical protein SP4CHLAM5_10270 [Chlamydiia bacterium]|nr:hypothetical protein [Chlamydiia bacterium]MCH9623955.1 hypothetical protein [Chlamydiia bacterium]